MQKTKFFSRRAIGTALLAIAAGPALCLSAAAQSWPTKPIKIVVGFAAETEHVVDHATAKRARKGCDWIVANDVSGDVMGGANNAFHIVTKDGVESWPDSPKDVIARKLMERVANALAQG